jgi:hypothetical protein
MDSKILDTIKKFAVEIPGPFEDCMDCLLCASRGRYIPRDFVREYLGLDITTDWMHPDTDCYLEDWAEVENQVNLELEKRGLAILWDNDLHLGTVDQIHEYCS